VLIRWLAWHGRALGQLEIIAKIPATPTYGDLKFNSAGILCAVTSASTRSLSLPADSLPRHSLAKAGSSSSVLRRARSLSESTNSSCPFAFCMVSVTGFAK
jgi:hypothetical protein